MRRTRTPETRNRGDNVEAVCLRVEVFEELTLRALRREKKPATVQAKAELLKLNRDTVRRLGQGSYEPTLGTAMHIARVLGTKVDKLWGPVSEVHRSDVDEVA